MVKDLVQKSSARVGKRFPIEGHEGFGIEAERVLEGFVGEVKLAVQVEVLPAHG